jgi:hypothetical protein
MLPSIQKWTQFRQLIPHCDREINTELHLFAENGF